MITAIILSLAMTSGDGTVCPLMGGAANPAGATVDYVGVRYAFCCGGCPEAFAKDPVKSLAPNAKTKGKNIGVFLFDPVSHNRLDADQSKGHSAYKGVIYNFQTAANKKAFDKAPSKFIGATPTKVSLNCPVSGEKIDGYANAFAYNDYKGVRYFICCGDCAPAFAKDPSKFAAKASANVVPAVAIKHDPSSTK